MLNDYEDLLYEKAAPKDTMNLRDFLEGKGYDWFEVINGNVKDISPLTFEHLLDDVKEGKNHRKMWFRIKSAKAANNYHENNKWSNLEEEVADILKELDLKEGEDWYHNYKLQNEDQTGYYSLDFLFPKKKVILEVDGEIWHGKVGDAEKKDIRRDKWLERLGFETIRLAGKVIDDKQETKRLIREVI